MKEKLLVYDFYSCHPRLYLNGKERYHTFPGFILTIITHLLLLLMIILYCFLFYSDDNYLIFYSHVRVSGKILEFGAGSFSFRIVDSNENEVPESVLTINPFLYEKFMFYGEENYTKINVTTTRTSKDSQTQITTFSSSNQPLRLVGNQTHYRNIQFFISKCVNSTDNNFMCLEESEIDKYLIRNTLKLQMYFNSVYVNHQEYYKPVKNNSYVKYIDIIPGYIYKLGYKFKGVKYKTNTRLSLFQREKIFEGFYFDESVNNVVILNSNSQLYYPNTIYHLTFEMNQNYQDNYQRSYKKFHEFFSTIGGNIYLIVSVAKILGKIITKGGMFAEIVLLKTESKKKEKSPSRKTGATTNGFKGTLSGLKNISTIGVSNCSLFSNANNSSFSNIRNNPSWNTSNENKFGPPSQNKQVNFFESLFFSTGFYNKKSEIYKYLNECEDYVKSMLDSKELIKTQLEMKIVCEKFKSTFQDSNNAFSFQNTEPSKQILFGLKENSSGNQK